MCGKLTQLLLIVYGARIRFDRDRPIEMIFYLRLFVRSHFRIESLLKNTSKQTKFYTESCPLRFKLTMAFTFVALSYIIALILTALLIFFAIWHVSHPIYSDEIPSKVFFFP